MIDYQLYIAAGEGNLDLVKSLSKSSERYQEALNDSLANAIWNEQYHVIEYFLSLPETPIAYQFQTACAKGNMKIFSMFISKGVDVNPSWKSFTSPIICAVENNHIEIVKALIEHGAVVTDINNGITVLDIAIANKNNEMANLLRSSGATRNKFFS